MQQRAAFCRALIHDPPLMLMDEPLGALDAMTREQLRGDLEALWMRDPQDGGASSPTASRRRSSSPTRWWWSRRGPGRIVRDIAVDLPRPRDLEVCETPAFQGLVAEIKAIFRAMG